MQCVNMEIKVEEYEMIRSDADSPTSEETRFERLWRYTKYFLKKFIAFLFSHVGLTCMVVVYAMLGGFLFQKIEAPNEIEVRHLVMNTKQDFVDRLLNILDNSTAEDVFRKTQWLHRIDNILSDYKCKIHKVTEARNWDGKFGDEDYQWTFADALLFSVTVITTIGYGHIAPRTTGGKLLTIAYAIFGIPLTMLCLRNIGNLMAVIFRMIYRHTCVSLTYQYIRLKRRRLKKVTFQKLRQRGILLKKWAIRKRSSFLIRVASINRIHEHNTVDNDADLHKISSIGTTYLEPLNDVIQPELIKHVYRGRSMSFCPTSSAIMGQRDSQYKELVEGSDRGRLTQLRCSRLTRPARAFSTRRNTLCAIQEFETLENENDGEYIATDRLIDSENLTNLEFPSYVKSFNYDRRKSSLVAMGSDVMPLNATEGSPLVPAGRNSVYSVSDDDRDRLPPSSLASSFLSLGDLEDEDLVLKQRLQSTREMVPISVVLLLMTGYMIMGAMMFSPWEQWDFLTGFYFCFVTLTSIGFGDIVPGSGATDWDSDEKGVLIVLYLLFGMSLLAMSFHLIQEEVKHKCRKIGIKMGLLEDRLHKMLDRIGENT